MRFFNVKAAGLMLFTFVVTGGAADTGFVSRLKQLPAVSQPTDPFVWILTFGGLDGQTYGFRSDGAMTED